MYGGGMSFPQQPVQLPPAPLEPEKPRRWWKTWITQNKIGVITALVMFAVIAFILPKLQGISRFAETGELPRYILAMVSVAGGSIVSAIDFAV